MGKRKLKSKNDFNINNHCKHVNGNWCELDSKKMCKYKLPVSKSKTNKTIVAYVCKMEL